MKGMEYDLGGQDEGYRARVRRMGRMKGPES